MHLLTIKIFKYVFTYISESRDQKKYAEFGATHGGELSFEF